MRRGQALVLYYHCAEIRKQCRLRGDPLSTVACVCVRFGAESLPEWRQAVIPHPEALRPQLHQTPSQISQAEPVHASESDFRPLTLYFSLCSLKPLVRSISSSSTPFLPQFLSLSHSLTLALSLYGGVRLWSGCSPSRPVGSRCPVVRSTVNS